MTLITPVGNSNFSWAPKVEGLTKTASTGAPEKSDKDLLFDAAKKFVKAQAEKFEKSDKEDKSDDKSEKSDKSEDKSDDKSEKSDSKPCDDKPCDDKPEVDAAPSVDVQKAVQELVDKSEKAEEIAQKVQDAVSKVEEAVQGVKDAAGVASDALPAGSLPADGVGEEIPGLSDGGEVDEVELEIEEPGASDVSTESPLGEGLIKESLPSLGDGPSDVPSDGPSGVKEFGVMASANDFVKLSAISNETRKKVTNYWQDYLGFPSDYVKLMVKNYEK